MCNFIKTLMEDIKNRLEFKYVAKVYPVISQEFMLVSNGESTKHALTLSVASNNRILVEGMPSDYIY